ncbi:MAG: hypothetical protein JO340_05865 [Acidobacteriaceae bacterium]|nr:hypothetical protein [Acidobacteriaceae bacterium]
MTIEKENPELQFSAAVIDSHHRPVGLTPRGQNLYHPPAKSVFVGGGGPVPLAPRDEVQYDWQISEFFDVSEHGTYLIAITRTFDTLKQTIGSNTIEVQAP